MELPNAILVSESRRVKELKDSLEALGYYDSTRRIAKQVTAGGHKLNDDSSDGYALPLTPQGASEFKSLLDREIPLPHPFEGCILIQHTLPLSRKQQAKESNTHDMLNTSIGHLLNRASDFGVRLTSEERTKLLSELPKSWERHSDLVVLPSTSFVDPLWGKFTTGPLTSNLKVDDLRTKSSTPLCTFNLPLWDTVASVLKCKRLAKDDKISCNEFRTSHATLLLGKDGWVEHVDNGVRYVFDVTKCMFSSGNVSEKIRVAGFKCSGETVVDLYAGVGYFTLPYLVHCGAAVVHACEWNGDAVKGLRRGLVANGVDGRCVVHVGDCRKLSLHGIADRVNLGLVPSSEGGWPVACAALKRTTDGWLHIHGNVSTSKRSNKGRNGCHGDGCCGIEGNPWETEDSPMGRVEHLDHVTQADDHVIQQRDHISQHATSKKDIVKLDSVEFLPKVKVHGHGGQEECKDNSEAIFEVKESGINETHNSVTNKRQVIVEVCSAKKQAWQAWGCYVAEKIHQLLCERNSPEDQDAKMWSVRVDHIEHVKSYAPHVDHLVADVECRPV